MLIRIRRSRAFTLVELMIVVVILAVLATVAVVSYRKYMRKARTQEAIGLLGDIQVKQAQYLASYGVYMRTTNDPTIMGGSDYFPVNDQSGENAGKTVLWNVDCNTIDPATPGGRFCQLGVRPAGEVYFQYKTLGWDPSNNTFAGNPPEEAIPNAAWVQNGSPRWWYAAATADFNGNGDREQDKVYVLLSAILREPVIKEEGSEGFPQ